MIGQSTTSFPPVKENQTMTLTTYNHYVDRVTGVNRIGCCNGSHGATLDTSKGRPMGKRKTVGVRLLRVLNDLLPRAIRPIKSKRARVRGGYGWKLELLTFKRVWHSHRKPAILKTIRKITSRMKGNK